jgi:hypothetical protein
MKTWGLFAFHVIGTGVPQSRVIVAAPSRAAAARAFGISSRYLDQWGSETDNYVETRIAEGEPGTVFVRGLDDHRGPYRRAVLDEHRNLVVAEEPS